jgi:hypothetical protein
VFAYNQKLSEDAVRYISEQDMDAQVLRKCKFHVIMNDDTVYRAISNSVNIRGQLFDQIIIVDDFRWHILRDKAKEIYFLTDNLRYSCVPEEFMIQKLEW